MSERYPQSVGNFERWYTALMTQIEHTTTDRGIEEAVQAIRDYADNKWCLPERLVMAERLAAKSRARINKGRSA